MTNTLQDKSSSLPARAAGSGASLRCLRGGGRKVVVNDPGGAADGSGTSATPAEEVVEEIKSAAAPRGQL